VKALQPSDPQWVGRYRLLRRLGSGGMGQVFLGQSPGGRLVAVKLIRADLAADPEFRARFAREVAAARHVSGIFTAAVVDADPDGPQPWLVTAYVPGPSLADAVAGHGPLPIRTALTLAAGLAEGLGAIHAHGMVHRDLKPSNVLLAGDGPRIIDFGISRAADATALTLADLVVGSPGFMSPEQAQGQEVGPSSDIFSLGAVLTFAATGEGPFGTGSANALLYRVVHDLPATGRLPGPIRPLVEGCLAKEPWRRPTTDQILAGLGTAQPAADWLPWPLSQETASYRSPHPPPAAPAAIAIPRSRLPGEPAEAPPDRSGGPPRRPPPRRVGQAGPVARKGRAAGNGPAVRTGPPAQRGPVTWADPVAPADPVGPSGTAGWGPAPGPPGLPGWGPAPPGRAPAPGTPNVPGSPPRPRWPVRQARPKRRHLGLWAVAALVVALLSATFIGVALTSHSATGGRVSPPSSHAPPGPRAVVLAYVAAVNARNWHRVWALGGKNLSTSYRDMVAGYRFTVHDELTRIKVHGDTVEAHLLARQASGAVHSYRIRYVVHGGVITAGHATLVGTG
jgi:Protein kinase domain